MSERVRAKELLARLGMSERRKQIYGEGIDRATEADLALASDGVEDALNSVDAGLATADHILARQRSRLAPEPPAKRAQRLTAICVYEPTTLTIHTDEDDLELEAFYGSNLGISSSTPVEVPAGIYKIRSWHQVVVTAQSPIDVLAGPVKDDRLPELPPRAQPLVASAVHAFFATPTLKGLKG